jgi:hypothetical protein
MPRSYFTETGLPPLNNLVVPLVQYQGHGQSGGGSRNSEGISEVVATLMRVEDRTQHTSIKESS